MLTHTFRVMASELTGAGGLRVKSLGPGWLLASDSQVTSHKASLELVGTPEDWERASMCFEPLLFLVSPQFLPVLTVG